MLALAKLKPRNTNPRTHSDAQITKIAASIREFGFTNPILIDASQGIIAGHGRLLAAKQLGMQSVPTITLDHLTDAQQRALVIADNQLALAAGWDADLLRAELEALAGMDFDLGLLGFGDDELAAWLAAPAAGLTDPDDVPPAPAEPVTQPGDVWLMGRHRLLCGDATSADDVATVLGSVKPHLMVTDPPYGVSYDADWRNDALQAGRSARGAPGGRAIGKVENDTRADWREAWALFPGEVAYVWHGALHITTVVDSLRASGFEPRSLIIWAKQQFVISRGHYHNQHEPCWYAVRDGKTAHWSGDRKQTTLWQIDKPHKSETGHSTQKPVECMRRPIENNSSPGQAVYEPFSGSGTTIIAAEMTGRICHAIEIAPAYVDVAVLRWQNFAGQVATLERTGEPFTAKQPAEAA